MTRKDYILISDAVREARDKACIEDDAPETRAVDIVATELADALGRGNARFDKARFLKACGVQS